MIQPAGNAQQFRDLGEEGRIGRRESGDVGGNLDVRSSIQGWQQIEFLKDESDFLFPQLSAFAVRERCEVYSVDGYTAGVGARQSAQQIKQRRFATA